MKGPWSLTRPPASLYVSTENKLAKTTQHLTHLFYPSAQVFSLQKTTMEFCLISATHHEFTLGISRQHRRKYCNI